MGTDPFTAFFDANVIYPSCLRDFLMRLAIEEPFRAKWSNHVHEEWMKHVEADFNDVDREAVERIRDKMNEHVEDSVVTGYEPLIESFDLPDPDDRHVLAAALLGRADVIVTKNLNDFPSDYLAQFSIEAQHPDTFVSHVFDLYPERVLEAARKHRVSLKNPPKTVDEYLASLEQQGLTLVTSELRQYKNLI